jgi:capsular polysaccharide transport system permease protein
VIEAQQSGGLLSFGRSLAIQLRVIGALLLREILTRHGRQNIGFMWVFVEPMMFTTGVVLLWSSFHQKSHTGIPLVAFTVTGYATVLMWRNTIGRSGDAVRSNKPLMFHHNVRVLDLFIARLLLESAGASISFAVLSSFFIFVDMMELPYDILKIIFAWLLLTWFSMAMGMIIGSLTVFSEIFNRLWHVFSYLFLPMSGAFFMVEWLPSRYQELALIVPTVDCVEYLRDGFFGPSVRTHYHITYLLCVNLSLMMIGLRMINLAARKLEDGAV